MSRRNNRSRNRRSNRNRANNNNNSRGILGTILSSLVPFVGPMISTALGAATGQGQRPKRGRMVSFSGPRSRKFNATSVRNGSMPGAFTNEVRSYFTTTQTGPDTMHVSGCDLVTTLADSVLTTDGSLALFTCIPANPAYWTGTRIGQLAPAYVNYRPLKMSFHYIPQVSVNTPGTVIMGTLWNASAPASDLQQTLLTSNGGLMNQVYLPADTTVKLGSNLPINLYSMRQDFGPDSNPFIFVAALRGSDVIPGTFYVSYEFDFKNPIGSAWTYGVRPFIYPRDVESHDVSSVVLLEETTEYGPGTVFKYENGEFSHEGEVVSFDDDVFITEYWADQGSTDSPARFLPSLYGVWNDQPNFRLEVTNPSRGNVSGSGVALPTFIIDMQYTMIPLTITGADDVSLTLSNASDPVPRSGVCWTMSESIYTTGFYAVVQRDSASATGNSDNIKPPVVFHLTMKDGHVYNLLAPMASTKDHSDWLVFDNQSGPVADGYSVDDIDVFCAFVPKSWQEPGTEYHYISSLSPAGAWTANTTHNRFGVSAVDFTQFQSEYLPSTAYPMGWTMVDTLDGTNYTVDGVPVRYLVASVDTTQFIDDTGTNSVVYGSVPMGLTAPSANFAPRVGSPMIVVQDVAPISDVEARAMVRASGRLGGPRRVTRNINRIRQRNIADIRTAQVVPAITTRQQLLKNQLRVHR